MMRPLILWMMAIAFLVVWNANAHAHDARTPIRARVVCEHPAEDSMAHLRLTSFTRNTDGSISVVYHCRRFGY